MTGAADASNAYFDTVFATQRVMAILRGYGPDETVRLCERAWSSGIDVVEVPIQSPEAVPSLRAAVAAGASRGLGVGAGTVTSAEQLDVVCNVGAAFTVAPGLDREVVRAALDAGIPHLPGVATGSEIQAARALGLVWLKAFPAAQLGAGWISAQLAPFPDVKFVATGGMSAATAEEFIAAGARVVALGSALNDAASLSVISRLASRPE